MKIAHVGKNLANVPYSFCKASRQAGLDADAYIGAISNPAEDPEEYPGWLHYSKGKLTSFSKFSLLKSLRSYDLLHTYAGASKYAQFLGKPFIFYATGSDLHEIPYQSGISGALMRRSLKKAKKVLFSNANLLRDISAFNLKEKSVFIPQPMDTQSYGSAKPEIFKGDYDLVVFHPTRQHWRMKGNDVFLRAFARASKKKKMLLLMHEWGDDLQNSRQLVKQLGIGASVRFLPLTTLHSFYSRMAGVDLVADQFVLGSMGLVTLGAMAAGKPVIVSIDEKTHRSCYPDKVPVLNASTEEEIYQLLISLNKSKCSELGKAAQAWILKNHSYSAVSSQLIGIYKELGLC
ncbi:D-inositol-3-phosphate glycosyltransferase [Candidatus Gugararchaeum adminiculabundum]|nr:D-inositol-3-phosphate glycosyltransferase [Candidatus Gugararchaeum adminiculabundum]